MFLEYLPESIAQMFGFATRAFDDEDFMARRAFTRGGRAYLEGGDQFDFGLAQFAADHRDLALHVSGAIARRVF